LFVIGFANPLSGNLREIRIEARRLGRAAITHLQNSTESVENVVSSAYAQSFHP
jgi:hypothetical protein